MKALKRWIDRRAIAVATRMMPPARAVAVPMLDGAALLADESLLRPPEITPSVVLGADGEFEFDSTVPSGSAVVDRVYGRFFGASGSAPTVILIHGWNAELHYLYGFPRLARKLNTRGWNAIAVELPYHLRRRPRRPAETRDFISDDLPAMLHATRQAIGDLEGLARWARERGSSGVALWGFSLGGWLAGLHLTKSSSMDVAVLTTPISGLRRAIETLPFCFPVRAALERNPLPIERLDLYAHRPRIAVDKIRVEEAIHDEFVPSDSYGRLAAAWGLSSWRKVPQSHISILVSGRSMVETMDWLDLILGSRKQN